MLARLDEREDVGHGGGHPPTPLREELEESDGAVGVAVRGCTVLHAVPLL